MEGQHKSNLGRLPELKVNRHTPRRRLATEFTFHRRKNQVPSEGQMDSRPVLDAVAENQTEAFQFFV
jgi:hypothetical protein